MSQKINYFQNSNGNIKKNKNSLIISYFKWNDVIKS